MPKLLQFILAAIYVALIILGLSDVFYHQLHGVLRIIFLSLLGIISLMMVCVMREEENEELKDN
jgi:hypothetical protein